jgi:undecaprenyl-diphosphatase
MDRAVFPISRRRVAWTDLATLGAKVAALGVIIIVLGVAAGLLIARPLHSSVLTLLDHPIARFMMNHSSFHTRDLMNDKVSFLATPRPCIIVVLVTGVVLSLLRHSLRPFLVMCLALVGSFVFTEALKLVVNRVPPGGPTGTFQNSSYPSGHMLLVVTIYGMLALLAASGAARPRRLVVWSFCAAVVFAVGFSRIYVNAHWTTDVVLSAIIGAAWVNGLWRLLLQDTNHGLLTAPLARPTGTALGRDGGPPG